MQIELSRTIAKLRSGHRWIVPVTLGLLAVALFLYVIVPLVASTRIVKERIAFEMSAWSGYHVSIGSAPIVRLFPLRAVLTDVTLTEWTRDAAPVLAADQAIINLSPLAALTGDIYFAKVRLVRPVLRVERNESGIYLPRLPGGGRMANAVKDAQVLTAANPENPDLSSLPGDPFGTVEFLGGRIVSGPDDEEVVASLEGIASWPRLDRSGLLRASGRWRGETVIVELSSSEPMALITGGTAPIHVAFAGSPGNAAFDGTANLSEKPFFSGQAAFSTSSLRRLLEWSHADIGTRPEVNAVSVRGRIQGGNERIKFEDLELSMDGSSGSGVVDLALGQRRPALSGTLAFQQLDLNSFVSALAPVGSNGARSSEVDTTFTERLSLDLRMSAARATVGTISLSEVAATAQMRDGLAIFDISDASAFDGRLQAGLRFDRTEQGTEVETSLRATDIDGAAFGQTAGLSRVIPTGRASFSLMLKGPVSRWDDFTKSLAGTVTASFGPGAIPNLDLAKFVAKTQEGGFFALREVATGSLAINKLALKASITNNLARINIAQIDAGQNVIDLSGVVSYAGRGLALRGSIRNSTGITSATPDARETARFFVGGTWSEPFISPTPVPPRTD
ncbi:AsmA family protein [Arvimicrobium flavum]|uniref:AsmA family protein n=1 Tax=Arvimicrobium flavum TaxID=3393320 RepID=UPI00237A8AE3|nr:AsmA-like C-terminal region-containing protein [Mesorhizobium shangrilense]